LYCHDRFVCTFQSMQILKKSDLRPYFIFIAPGSMAKLKQMRHQQGVSVTVCSVMFLLKLYIRLKCRMYVMVKSWLN